MNIGLFNKPYTVRRFGKQKVVKGYVVDDYTELSVNIHLHPSGSDQIKANPQGSRRMKRLEGHGNVELFTANESTNRKGDLISYNDEWYECVSCVKWDHTLLSHYNYQFVLVPTDAKTAKGLGPAHNIPGDEDCDDLPWYYGDGGDGCACK